MSKNAKRKQERYGGLTRAQRKAQNAKHVVAVSGSDEHTSNLHRRVKHIRDLFCSGRTYLPVTARVFDWSDYYK